MRISALLIFMVFTFQLKAQVNVPLIKHFAYNDLNNEHKTYLELLEQQHGITDSLKYFKTKFSLLNKDTSNFIVDYKNCSLCYSDTNLLKYSASYLAKISLKQTRQFWEQEFGLGYHWSKKTLLYKSFDLLEHPENDVNFLPYTLQIHYNEYRHASQKKLWAAGLLSAIIPGAGKLYIGRERSFFGSFLVNTLYGITAYESIKKKGFKNGYTIFATGAFSIFYLSNIYGTIFDLKRLRIEKKKHFLYEVSDYQSSGIYLY